jgi:hypothetical protein
LGSGLQKKKEFEESKELQEFKEFRPAVLRCRLLLELLELLELLNSFLRCGSSILTSTFILKKYRPTR